MVEGILTWGQKSLLSKAILEQAKLHLLDRVNNKPQPPADWSRPVPKVDNGYKKVWAILADFLSSATQQVFDYTRVHSDRSMMESALANVKIDIRTETIKKGSPHTLRLIKTQGAFERNLKDWKVDVALLEKVELYLK